MARPVPSATAIRGLLTPAQSGSASTIRQRSGPSPTTGPNVSGAGGSGHVAYVAQVNGDGTIVIEEYNWAPFPYGYHHPPRVIRASDVSNFIHIVS